MLNGSSGSAQESSQQDVRDKAYYSSSSSFGKFTVQSSSRKQMGLPRRMDIDLSAGNEIENGEG